MSGEFEKGKKSARNIEVYLGSIAKFFYHAARSTDTSFKYMEMTDHLLISAVFLDDGSQVKECIFPGVGDEVHPVTEYVSMVFAHTNSPHWRETIKISLSPEKTLRAHLRLQFMHCSSDSKDKSEKKFCFAFLPLAKKGTIISSADHTLPLYKYEQIMENGRGPPLYLSDATIPRFHKDCQIRIQMSSTSFTQNEQVYSLLRWKTIATDEEIKQALHLLQFTPPLAKDVLPFLPDFFDALLAILEKFVYNSAYLRLFWRHLF